MSDILVLDRDTANRIAAGEVVERPASVIKELVENAIDADATAITVEARDAGVTYMRVTDNGKGMRAQDVRIAFERHATSKLRSGDPLTDIRTMGFRGEALPSIAAVSKVELTTRQAGALSGVRISVEGGEVLGIKDAGCPDGTTVIVRDLFYNTPARLKFLKRPQTESAVLCETVAQLALSHPRIAFRMILGAKQLYHTPGNGDVRRVAALVDGVERADALLDVSTVGAIGISGLLGVGDNARGSRAGETFFVNGRVVRNRLLSAWVEDGCRESVMVGRYPYCTLFIDMPPGSVDVNVHPNKLEVRFTDEYVVRDALINAVNAAIKHQNAAQREALLYSPPSKTAPREPEKPLCAIETAQLAPLPIMPFMQSSGIPAAMREAYVYTSEQVTVKSSDKAPVQAAIETAEPDKYAYTMIGQLFDLYLLVHDDNMLYIVDQHAAHERILYDRMTKAEQRPDSQLLLEPFLMELSMREMALVEEHNQLLNEMGFELGAFGATTLRVSAVPVMLGNTPYKQLLQDIAGALEAQRNVTASELQREKLISMACKHAVKDGDKLDDAQIEYILSTVLAEDMPLTCPHGRPILQKLSKAELERKFKR